MRREFIDCLNNELKIFNCNFFAIILGVFLFCLFGLLVGLVFAIVFCVLGFFVGNYMGSNWHAGVLQRRLYWCLPYPKIWICNTIPNSCNKYEI
jgi:hypothetical protein